MQAVYAMLKVDAIHFYRFFPHRLYVYMACVRVAYERPQLDYDSKLKNALNL